MALAARLDGMQYRIYVILGDGEINEGQVWEAAMFAAFHKLDLVVAILDRMGSRHGVHEGLPRHNALGDK